MSDTQARIDDLVKQNEVMLFMKGSASFPMCGFSGRAIQILKACGVDPKPSKRLTCWTMQKFARASRNTALADYPSVVRQGRVHWRLRHHDGNVRVRRTAPSVGHHPKRIITRSVCTQLLSEA